MKFFGLRCRCMKPAAVVYEGRYWCGACACRYLGEVLSYEGVR